MHGWWMYTEEKHTENRRQLREVLQEVIRSSWFGAARPSFDIVSPLSADEALFYLIHASFLVPDQGGFSEVAARIAKWWNGAVILQ